ncbi:hypothetical protein KSF_105330 [Reticulibacter mediterranei]|uniref:Tetratricopeptide repeat protein n=1 Tax=Reticulibacter mediterranei TaxID=2778369 RepID=A0A8J3J1C3_9CHLR|nr:tetratricopeptide repeat protein [Reticulibacter mediterranei]GHP00486.1 hypothetical protein KSF_105330 [Reticulibacter mediterranei]
MFKALERHEKREACVIPIILRPVDWAGVPFEKLQVLPKNAKAVTSWRLRDQAFVEIVQEIRKVIHSLRIGSGKQDQGAGFEGMRSADLRSNYEEFIDWSKYILRRDPENAEIYFLLADALKYEGFHDKALALYGWCLQFRPRMMQAYYGIGNVLYLQAKFSEAQTVYERAIQLDPTNPYAYYSYCIVYFTLYGERERGNNAYKEAINAYKEAIAYDPRLKLNDLSFKEEAIDYYLDWEYALPNDDKLAAHRYEWALRSLYNALCREEAFKKWLETGQIIWSDYMPNCPER